VANGLAPGLEADVLMLAAEPADPASLLGLEGELLEGVGVAASPAFESWLVVEWHRIAAVVEARLRHAALGPLAGGAAAGGGVRGHPAASSGSSRRRRCGTRPTPRPALAALGGALVHAVRGRDEEDAVILHENIRLATLAGDRETAVTARRSWGSSRCRPAGARPPRPGWPGPRRWPTPTPSSPRSSGCGP